VTRLPNFLSLRFACGLILLCAFGVLPARCQEPAASSAKPTPKSAEASEKTPDLPAQIELLETRVRFEVNGDSRKEVHTRVHINNELGARQFARLAFDYNRSFQQIEFPLVRITHSGGGTVDILPSAISDQPNPAVVNAPAYQDVRVKSVRILGLAPEDILEYRVVTTTSHHPLAPDFWLDHTFDRSGVTAKEIFEIDLPSSRSSDAQSIDSAPPQALAAGLYNASLARVHVSPHTPAPTTETTRDGNTARVVYRWQESHATISNTAGNEALEPTGADIVVSTFASWLNLGASIGPHFLPPGTGFNALAKKLYELEAAMPGKSPLEAVYTFVSQKIKTVDLPLGSTGFQLRHPLETLSSGYGTPEDKVLLFAALSRPSYRSYYLLFIGVSSPSRTDLPDPSVFSHIAIQIPQNQATYYLDPSVEVAPFGIVPADFRGKTAFVLQELLSTDESKWWTRVPNSLPFLSTQRVKVDAVISPNGALTAKVKYTMRGDNELLLRVAFHQSPKERWKEVAQLLALSDGFRGKITNVTASDPYATQGPFTVEYEITQSKFVDWSKKPVRIPALLPLVGLPDLPAKPAAGAAPSTIDLGTPLDVEAHLTLHLPAGTVVRTPTGTSVERDYATFASKYQASDSGVTASRHLNFLLRRIPTDRAADYNAFVRAVQSDEAQEFILNRGDRPATAQGSAPAATPGPKP